MKYEIHNKQAVTINNARGTWVCATQYFDGLVKSVREDFFVAGRYTEAKTKKELNRRTDAVLMSQ